MTTTSAVAVCVADACGDRRLAVADGNRDAVFDPHDLLVAGGELSLRGLAGELFALRPLGDEGLASLGGRQRD